MNELPHRLSALIRIAVADMAKCAADPNYVLRMSVWHMRPVGQPCSVCLAGSVMAKTLGFSPARALFDVQSLETHLALKMVALDCVRSQRVDDAFYHLGIECNAPHFNWPESYDPEYPDSAVLLQLADHLDKWGY